MADKKTWLNKDTEDIAKKPEYAGKTILKNMHPQKMSEVLLNFSKPLLDEIDQLDKLILNSALKIAVVVWNYSVLMDKSSLGFMDRMIKKSMETIIVKMFSDEIGKSVFQTLLDRKKSLYPDNKRGITDFNIKWDNNCRIYYIIQPVHPG